MDVKKFVLSYYRNATKNFYIFRLTHPTEATKLHSHDYFQIYYVLRGNLTHHLQGRKAPLSGGDVFILPPNVPHYIEVHEGETDFFALSFTPEFIQGTENVAVSDFLQVLVNTPLQKIQPKLVLPHSDTLFVDTLLKRIHKEFEAKETAGEAMVRECTLVLLTLFARLYFEENAESIALGFKKETFLHCLEYVQNHFNQNITLDEISKRFAISRSSFCNLFLSAAGVPFKEYLNTYRIQSACQMLKEGEKASSVAEKCGFSDFSTFYRNFKKRIGLSPTKYRLLESKKRKT